MKRTVISRYEKTGSGLIIIDVAAPKVEMLYNDFDRKAPYVRRDLERDLVDYLIECAGELKREDFILRFSLDQAPDESQQSRIRSSINAYFLYLAEIERQRVLRMFRRSAILFLIGLAILFLAVSFNRVDVEERSVIANVFAEGLTVAAWVSLWESLAVFLIEWFPLRSNIGLYRKLAASKVTFRDEE